MQNSKEISTQNNKMTQTGSEDTSHQEFHKAFYDYLKHLSTISTGSIVLLAAFLENIFKQPRWKPLVAVSVAGFLVTVVASVITYSVMVLNFPRPGITRHAGEANTVLFAVLLTWVGFISGVVSLAVFIVRNLFA